MRRGKRSTLDNRLVDWIPIRRISVLSLFNFRKFEVNQDLIFEKAGSKGRGRECGVLFTREVELGVVGVAVVVYVKLAENGAKGAEISDEEKGAQDRALGTPVVTGEGLDLKDLSWMN